MGFEEELKQIPEEAREFVAVVLDELQRKGFDKLEAWNRMKQIAESKYVRESYADNPVGLWTYAAEATKAITKRQRSGDVETVDAIIPVGVTPLRTTKQGKRSSIFALIKTENGWDLHEIVFRGALALSVDKVSLFKVYSDITLTNRGYFYEANMNTKFNSYVQEIEDLKVLKKLNIKRVKMSEMKNALSRIDDQGFVDRTDLRAFEGFVSAPWKKITDDRHIAAYDVTDNTLEDADIGADGTIVKPSIRVWCHPMFAKYGEDSKLLFIGTLEKRRDDNVVQMNAIYVKPITITSIVDDE